MNDRLLVDLFARLLKPFLLMRVLLLLMGTDQANESCGCAGLRAWDLQAFSGHQSINPPAVVSRSFSYGKRSETYSGDRSGAGSYYY